MNTFLHIADQFTQEPSGKWTVRGLYPDATMVVMVPESHAKDPGAPPLAIDALTCALTVSDLAAGKHRFKGRMYDPKGLLNTETPDIDFDTPAPTNQTFPFQVKPFVITGGAGTYVWNFELDGKAFTHSFEVRLSPESA